MLNTGTARPCAGEELFRDDSSALLAQLAQPWLFVVPGADTAEPPAYQVARAGLLPDSRHVVLEGEGHMVPQERPDLVAQHVSRFLEDVLRGSSSRGDGR